MSFKAAKQRLLDILLATDGLPGWVCVGHPDPLSQVQVFLETAQGTLDITRNHIIVALKPLTIAIAAVQTQNAKLVIRDTASAILGEIHIQLHQSIPVHSAHICLFHTTSGRNHCAPTLRREATYLHERWKMSRDKKPHTVQMTPSDLFNMWILHHVPRPVHLVSYGEMTHGNMFPMDLLGSLSTNTFVIGMHADSPAIPIWQRTRQIAVSTVPLRWKATVYAMGKNHREPNIDPSTMPLASSPSASFHIPVPTEALSVRELTIQQSHPLGSHQLFIAQTHSFEKRSEEPQMCHVHRFYQQFLMRHNRSLPSL